MSLLRRAQQVEIEAPISSERRRRDPPSHRRRDVSRRLNECPQPRQVTSMRVLRTFVPLEHHRLLPVEHRAAQVEDALLVAEDALTLGLPSSSNSRTRSPVRGAALIELDDVQGASAAAALDADADRPSGRAALGKLGAHAFDRLRGGADRLLGDAGVTPSARLGIFATPSLVVLLIAPRSLRVGARLLVLRRGRGDHHLRGLLGAEIGDRALDRVLGQHRAVDLDRREVQLLRDHAVLDGRGLVDGLALEPLGRERRTTRSPSRSRSPGISRPGCGRRRPP